ncbi:hypothetical protein [Paracidovorax anthurii]|nr:hypothetical protein [Paracidovorax anthurii]
MGFVQRIPNGIYLGNRAYVQYLLGKPQQAEDDFCAALQIPEGGDRDLYEATLKDLDIHPIPEDQGMRKLVERAWTNYQGKRVSPRGVT